MSDMKRYALFGMRNFYPNGGWNDFVDTFDDPREAGCWALKDIELEECDFFQIVDMELGTDITSKVNELLEKPA